MALTVKQKNIRIGLAAITLLVIGALVANSLGNDPETTVKVERVIDGDTFVAEVDGVVETVRLIGINAPELGSCYATQSHDLLARLVDRSDIWLATGMEKRDPYGRLLAYVFHDDGFFVNLEMVRAGAAEAMTMKPNNEFASLIGEAHDEAAIASRGGWSRC
tara:strand:+ start:1448 stop:1933 length:486 start_codon:yes stop_codon:yes gene_type:complete